MDIGDFNFAAISPTVRDWDEFFAWHHTHKPPKLIFRSAAKFLAGLDYALNDYAGHDPKTCAVSA